MAQEDWVGSRRLLRRMRDLMAGPGSAQARLDKIAKLIARDMVAEVCSIYARRAGDILELFATQGLRKDAVHQTRLRVGEGLVGHIAANARPLSLSDAQAHPLFAYRPETGEEAYKSLMGVPILRGGRGLGVLAIQNRTSRQYSEEEVEALETVAMVLAELLAGGEVVPPSEIISGSGFGLLPERLEGLILAPGLAGGAVRLHQPRVTVDRMVADDPAGERDRLRAAVDATQVRLHGALESLSVGDQSHDIIETFSMIIRDRGWLRRIDEAILSGLTAEAAVQRVQDDTRARMLQVADPYLRERLLDLDDLANRFLRELTGKTAEAMRIEPGTVLVARSMGPAELLDYRRDYLQAVVLEEGSATSHATIVARAIGVPMVGRVHGITSRVEPGDTILVDGDHGIAFVRPGEEVQAAFQASVEARGERQREYTALKDKPAQSLDGIDISLQMNAGLLLDLPQLAQTGADGIGLFRTEIAFLSEAQYPGTATQTRFYRRVIAAAADKPVVFRTLDVGGDKVAPHFGDTRGENPSMGWRALRVSLDRPAMLRHQVRALLSAAAGRHLRLMFPMVSDASEFVAARRILHMEQELLPAEERPSEISVGAMIEVPAITMQLEALSRVADFASVGSNDLLQFLFASDRGDPHISRRYDALSPPMLRFLARIAADCDRLGLPVGLCGEMAGDPLTAMALIGIGYRTLSMPGTSIGPVRAMIRSLDVRPLEDYAATLVTSSAHTIRPHLRAFALDHNVFL